MKTNELTGEALDLAVAQAMGRKYTDFGWWWDNFNPSTNWAHGGPIIEREKITAVAFGSRWEAFREESFATYLDVNEGEADSYGPTPLIAAMRCYVASKLGDEVDVPEELTQGKKK
tara:strand:+ start:446 stop:793 length:348 start_codon:yes stop_codon:yes gene_type:complete